MNEDAYSIDDLHGVYVVADGMGGHRNGEVASRLAVRSIREAFEGSGPGGGSWRPEKNSAEKSAKRIGAAIVAANQRVRDEVDRNPALQGMGTTVVALLVDGDEATIAHVGDSRAYLFRGRRLELLTSDHTWVNEQLHAGNLSEVQAQVHPFKSVVTRALGGEEQVDVEIRRVALEAGDLYVLCSDGLTTMVSEEEILSRLRQSATLDEACRELVQAANDNGGRDNVTVLLLSVE